MKRPKHCKGCVHYHCAGHKDGTRYGDSKYNYWCCKYSNAANKSTSICILQNGKQEKGESK